MAAPTSPIRIVALGASLLAVALAGGRRPLRAQSEVVPRDITIEVANDNFNDATVYAIRPGLRQRIGWVVGNTHETFKFRWLEGDLRVEIDLLAAGRYYTQVMNVQAGDELELTILPYLHTLPPGTVF